jgi:hypothetical protein
MASKTPLKSSVNHYVQARKQLELQAAALQQQLIEAREIQQANKDRIEVRCCASIKSAYLQSSIEARVAQTGGVLL